MNIFFNGIVVSCSIYINCEVEIKFVFKVVLVGIDFFCMVIVGSEGCINVSLGVLDMVIVCLFLVFIIIYFLLNKNFEFKEVYYVCNFLVNKYESFRF